MTPRRRVAWKRKIDWAAVNFAFVLVMAIITAAMSYAYLTGSTASKLIDLERRVDALEDARGGVR